MLTNARVLTLKNGPPPVNSAPENMLHLHPVGFKAVSGVNRVFNQSTNVNGEYGEAVTYRDGLIGQPEPAHFKGGPDIYFEVLGKLFFKDESDVEKRVVCNEIPVEMSRPDFPNTRRNIGQQTEVTVLICVHGYGTKYLRGGNPGNGQFEIPQSTVDILCIYLVFEIDAPETDAAPNAQKLVIGHYALSRTFQVSFIYLFNGERKSQGKRI